MKYKFTKYVFLLLLLVGAFFLGNAYAGTMFFATNFSYSGNGLVDEVEKIINDNYLGEVDPKSIFYGMAKGYVKGLDDPYSEFFDPEEAKLFWDDLDGEFEGIGVEIVLEDGMAKVMTVLSDSPAFRSGMQNDDIILAVDDVDVMGKALGEIASMIQGPAGSNVKITVLRIDKLIDIDISREKLRADSVYVSEEDGVLWVKVTRFDENSDDEVKNKILDYGLENIKGVILDLRSNPGGYFDASVNMADLFLKEGLIVVETNNRDIDHEFKAEAGDELENVKVVVLIDRGSASASEIVAGALKDNNRSKVIGEESYGKGSVQVVEELKDGSILKLTIAEWLTPNGVNLRLNGIVPDIEIENISEEDEQYNKARELLLKEE